MAHVLLGGCFPPVVNCTYFRDDVNSSDPGPGPGTYAEITNATLTDPDETLTPAIRSSVHLTNSTFRYLTRLSFQCLPGYERSNNGSENVTTRTCQDDAQYSGISHNCTSKILFR